MCYFNCTTTVNTLDTGGVCVVPINYRDPRPIYEQLQDGFRQLILSGGLSPGSKMPSVRELAASLAINPNTIQRAYRELEAEGCICSVPGRGSFVCETDAALLTRRNQLTDALRAAAKELRALGLTDEELTALIKEDSYD